MNYSHTSIAFVDEVLKASGAKSFYNFPDEPHVTDFVKDYKANGAFFEYSSSYVPRVGDVVAIESNGNASDGADLLGIISGVNIEGGNKESDRITATVEDETGYMVYGPYIKGLAEGDKEVTFRMKTDNNSADNDVVARIEVNDPDLGAIIASKEIRRKDFLTPDAFQDFLLEYGDKSCCTGRFCCIWRHSIYSFCC